MIWVIWAFAIGLCFGSFANVLVYRLPRKISIILPSSACADCKTAIAPYDLLPIISWLILKGRCRRCSGAISPRYPLVEMTCGLLFAGMVLFTPTLSAMPLSLFAFALLVVALIDRDTREIPDSLLIFAVVMGLGWVVAGHFSNRFPLSPDFINAGLGILAGGLPLLIIDRLVLIFYKKDGFGYGDVKLMAVSGIFLGWQMIIVAFICAFLAGGIYAAFLLVTGKAKRGEYIAFGPFLCTGVIIALWFGQAFWSFYI